MFDLIIMLSRYLFIFYIVLFLWQGIVYVAYEQGGFLGNPYTAVSMQRRITVLMHMTAFLILGYNRETYMFDITTLLFGAVSLVFLLFAVKLLDRFYYEGCPLIWTGMRVSDGCELDYFTEGGAFSGTQTADVDVHWAGRDVFSADLLPVDSKI